MERSSGSRLVVWTVACGTIVSRSVIHFQSPSHIHVPLPRPASRSRIPGPAFTTLLPRPPTVYTAGKDYIDPNFSLQLLSSIDRNDKWKLFQVHEWITRRLSGSWYTWHEWRPASTFCAVYAWLGRYTARFNVTIIRFMAGPSGSRGSPMLLLWH